MEKIYDTIILGGGPAAVGAAVYAARKQLQSLLVAESIGGQSIVSADIQNWIGDSHLSGFELAKKFETHLKSYPEVLQLKIGATIKSVAIVSCSEDRLCDFQVTTEEGAEYRSKSLIICTGAARRKLGVPGEAEFNGRGVAYCSTCDAPLFKNKIVAVIGGGNAGLEAVQDLLTYATKIYLLETGPVLRGDPVTQVAIKNQPKVEIIYNATVQEIMGDKLVTGLNYTDAVVGAKNLEVQGVFVEIGSQPNSSLVKDLVELDPFGQIITDMKYATTSHPGIFAAGDVTNDPFKQNNISAGDGVRAALSAYDYLLKRHKTSPAAE
jgi:alkyl hydroperoxide reductase subunit F